MQRTLRKGLSMFSVLIALAAAGAAPASRSAEAAGTNENIKATNQLFQAVHANDMAAVQASVGDGANVEARDRWGMTPADIAIDRGNYRIAHFLVSVRNSQHGQETPAAAAHQPAAPAVTPTAAGGGKPLARQPAAAAKPSLAPVGTTAAAFDSQTLAAGSNSAPTPAAAKSNPFDPAVPVYGSQLRPVESSAASR